MGFKGEVIEQAFLHRFPGYRVNLRSDPRDTSTLLWVNLGTNLACRLKFDDEPEQDFSEIDVEMRIWHFNAMEVSHDLEEILDLEMPDEVRSFLVFNIEILTALEKRTLTLQDVLAMLKQ